MEPAVQKIKETSIEAVIIRADGTREDLGVIAHSDWHWWSKERREARKRTKQANKGREV